MRIDQQSKLLNNTNKTERVQHKIISFIWLVIICKKKYRLYSFLTFELDKKVK